MSSRIYLDNAATSWPKPEGVYAAVDRYQRELGTAVGRAGTRAGLEVQRVVDRCRQLAATFFGADSPEQVAFAANGTDALNLALHGLLRPQTSQNVRQVITTVWDHNSVLRPLTTLQQRDGIPLRMIGGDSRGGIDLEQLQAALSTPTQLVVLTHASNVTGVLQPVSEVVDLAHQHGALVLLDAAQTAGHLPVSLTGLGVDMIACPGHKGLLGPLGTGLLILRQGLAAQLEPLRQGGTGTVSESLDQPADGSARFEAGNLNAPGIFGLCAALEWRRSSAGEMEHQEQTRIQELLTGLAALPAYQVAVPEGDRVGVVSISSDRIAPQILATLLDEHFGVECRAGLHCAPLAHRELGTLEGGGTVRFSVGPFTTAAEIDLTLEALAQIAQAF